MLFWVRVTVGSKGTISSLYLRSPSDFKPFTSGSSFKHCWCPDLLSTVVFFHSFGSKSPRLLNNYTPELMIHHHPSCNFCSAKKRGTVSSQGSPWVRVRWKWIWQPESWSPKETWDPGVNSTGGLWVSGKARKFFKDKKWSLSRGVQNECPLLSSLWTLPLYRRCLKGSEPLLSSPRTQTWSRSKKKLYLGCDWPSSLPYLFSLAPHHLVCGGSGRKLGGVTNIFESSNLLKMLMSKRSTPGSIKNADMIRDVFEPG